MTNFQVYKKTLSFSGLMFLVDLLGLVVVLGLSTLGFFIFIDRSAGMAIIGLIVGLILGIILASLLNIFVTNRIKAAQISMMTKGVTEDTLPDKTFSAGFNEIKGRFGRITGFYFITRAIKAIFNQIFKAINALGTAVGGDAGNAVTGAVNSAVQVLLGYLCDCCMGWVLFRKDVSMARAGCEGAVIFFKHGKTLFRNIGRIFGMGFLSLLIVGGAFFGISFAIFNAMPGMFESLSHELVEIAQSGEGDVPEFLTNTTLFMVVVAAILGVVLWSMVHSVLIRPFILVGVLRNYMASGLKEMPTEADFATLDAKSPRFAALHKEFQ